VAAGAPVWLYQFSLNMSATNAAYDLLGDSHGSEVPYVFGWGSQPPSAQDGAISAAFQAYWTNLATTGNPNSGPTTVPQNWPAYDAVGDVNLQIQYPITLNASLSSALCDFWDGVVATLGPPLQ
jgi:carboxylesterase type B